MSRVTLQTIADRVGVSRTTVSNAYNRPDQLAPRLRERILATAAELGYAGPDPAARRLRSGRRDAVGLLLGAGLPHALADPAAALLLQGIAGAAGRAGLPVLLVPAAAVRDAVVSALCVHDLPAGHADLRAALERGVPLVVVDGARLDGHSHVGVDDRGGARAAARHLLELGHERVAVLSGPQRGASARERLAGFRDALESAGLDWSAVPRGETARPLLDARPTAILAVADRLALDALDAARERALRVPDELSIVGFDDVPEAARAGPGLTTIRQPLLEKGDAAGRLLAAGGGPRDVRLPVELVVRGSTAPPG